MFALVIYLLSQLSSTALAIQYVEPGLGPEKRLEYAALIVAEAREHRIDPLLVVALIDRESDFRNLKRNRTDDYGLMQVHWQKAAWTEGLTRADLMDVRTNIKAGFEELSYWRRWCNGKRGPEGHHWINHYKSGNVVNENHVYYGNGIIRTYKWLRRATQGKTKDRYRRQLDRRNQS
ncbi:MAG: hypothetical protein DRP42_00535 [Tenericutes bacterium]|nr:MAG: hypothetical protein DRP42_00535 [Mycoplasmatota bacterium]